MAARLGDAIRYGISANACFFRNAIQCLELQRERARASEFLRRQVQSPMEKHKMYRALSLLLGMQP
jgi:hypothetical protein